MLGKYKIPIAVILGAVIIGVFTLFALMAQKSIKVGPANTASPMATTVVFEESAASPTLLPTASPTFNEDDEKAIKMALAAKLATAEASLEIAITQKDAKHAKGNVKEKTSQVGGGYFLAAKDDDQWVIVYDGQATPTCSQIAPYNFSTAMVSECLDASGKVVIR